MWINTSGDKQFDKILKALDECNCDLYSEDFNNEYPEYLMGALDKYDKDLITEYANGCFKVVLWVNSIHDYIIKIPFAFTLGVENELIDYKQFDREIDLYEDACEHNVEDILLELIPIGTVKNGYPIFAQKKVDTLYCCGDILIQSNEDIYKMDAAIRKDNKDEYYMISHATEDIAWNIYTLIYYGYKKGLEMLKFCYNRIGDLHEENIGFDGERPVIIDYGL